MTASGTTPDDRNLERDLNGLKWHLDIEYNQYAEDYFPENYSEKFFAYEFTANLVQLGITFSID